MAQGCGLSPILFSVFIDDLTSISWHVEYSIVMEGGKFNYDDVVGVYIYVIKEPLKSL